MSINSSTNLSYLNTSNISFLGNLIKQKTLFDNSECCIKKISSRTLKSFETLLLLVETVLKLQ